MSSIKDRIRNLQQSTSQQPSNSVAERAKAVERVDEPDTEQQKSLSQLKKRFDSNVKRDSGSGLGARVARFDSDAAQSLKDRVRRLESGASDDTRSLSARASAFEHSGSAVKDTAGQFSEQGKAPNEDTTTLHKARAMFETGTKDTSSVEKALSHLKVSQENGSKGVKIRNDEGKTASANPSEPKPPLSTTHSQEGGADGVSRRAAIFELAKSEPKPKAKAVPPTQRDAPRAQPALQPAQKDEASETNETSNANASKATEEKNLRDELREVKRANEELVSVLLELTSAFKNLESTRDELQKRIAELEKKKTIKLT